MTLEVLFARAAQGRTFLQMVLIGAGLGLGLQLSGALHARRPLFGMAADLLCALGMTAALCQVLLISGEGLRAYGLLGLCIGGTIYASGIAPAAGWLGRWVCRAVRRKGRGGFRRP